AEADRCMEEVARCIERLGTYQSIGDAGSAAAPARRKPLQLGTLLQQLAGPAGVVIALIALWFTYIQLPEKKAVLRFEVSGVDFSPRSPGRWLAVLHGAMKNEGTSVASNVYVDYQHHPLRWTGVVPPREAFEIAPKETKTFLIGADTVADPPGVLFSGTHLYFVIRTRWMNAATGKGGCDIAYVDIRSA